MKLTSTSPLLFPNVAPPPAAVPEPLQRPARPGKDAPDLAGPGAGVSRQLRPLAPASASDRQSLAQGFAFTRALTRGRIQGLQTALRILSQPPLPTTEAIGVPELPELRSARVALCDRLQAQYALFLAEAAASPEGLPRSSRGSWRRCQLRQLLQEDLDWVRSLPGDHQDLVRAIRAGLDRAASHNPL